MNSTSHIRTGSGRLRTACVVRIVVAVLILSSALSMIPGASVVGAQQSQSEIALDFEPEDNLGSPREKLSDELELTMGIKFHNAWLIANSNQPLINEASASSGTQYIENNFGLEFCCTGMGLEFMPELELNQIVLDLGATFPDIPDPASGVSVLAQGFDGSLLFERRFEPAELGAPDGTQWTEVVITSPGEPIAAIAITSAPGVDAPFDWHRVINGPGGSAIYAVRADNMRLRFTGTLPTPGEFNLPSIVNFDVGTESELDVTAISVDQFETTDGRLVFEQPLLATAVVDAAAGIADMRLELIAPDGSTEELPFRTSKQSDLRRFVETTIVDQTGSWQLHARLTDRLGRVALSTVNLQISSAAVNALPDPTVDLLEVIQGPTRQILDPSESDQHFFVRPDEPVLLRAFLSDASNERSALTLKARIWRIAADGSREGPDILSPNARVNGSSSSEVLTLRNRPTGSPQELDLWEAEQWLGGTDEGVQSWVLPGEYFQTAPGERLKGASHSRVEFDLIGTAHGPGSNSPRALVTPRTISPTGLYPTIGLHFVEMIDDSQTPRAKAVRELEANEIAEDIARSNPVKRVEVLSTDAVYEMNEPWWIDIAQWWQGETDCGSNLKSFSRSWGYGKLDHLRSALDDDAPAAAAGEIGYTVVVGRAQATGEQESIDSGGCAFLHNPRAPVYPSLRCYRCGAPIVTRISNGSDTVVHEIGHTLGLNHASDDHGECGGGGCDADFPRHGQVVSWPLARSADSGVFITAIDNNDYDVVIVDPCPGAEPSDRASYFPEGPHECPLPDAEVLHDTMSYIGGGGFSELNDWRRKRWWSSENLSRVNSALTQGFCSTGPNRVEQKPFGQVRLWRYHDNDCRPTETYTDVGLDWFTRGNRPADTAGAVMAYVDATIVSGVVEPSGEVHLLPVVRTTARFADLSHGQMEDGSAATIKLINANGETIAEAESDLLTISHQDVGSRSFIATLPAVPDRIGAIRVEVDDGETLEVKAGKEPTVTASQTETDIEWTISDPDSDKWRVVYDRFDNGKWIPQMDRSTDETTGRLQTVADHGRLSISDGINVATVEFGKVCQESTILCEPPTLEPKLNQRSDTGTVERPDSEVSNRPDKTQPDQPPAVPGSNTQTSQLPSKAVGDSNNPSPNLTLQRSSDQDPQDPGKSRRYQYTIILLTIGLASTTFAVGMRLRG